MGLVNNGSSTTLRKKSSRNFGCYRFHHHPGYYGIYDNYEYEGRNYEYGQPFRIKKLVIVEEWTYNHGPGRFMDHLRLENGVVRHIQSGDYGY